MDKNEDGQNAYSLEWTSSALDVDKRGKRHKLPVVIEVMDFILKNPKRTDLGSLTCFNFLTHFMS